MKEETFSAIQRVLDLWDLGALGSVSIVHSMSVPRAMIDLRNAALAERRAQYAAEKDKNETHP